MLLHKLKIPAVLMVEVNPPLDCFKLLKCPLPGSVSGSVVSKFGVWRRALHRAGHALG